MFVFAKTFVINLDRRPERLHSFQQSLPADWPFPPPERFAAIDGMQVEVPTWWHQRPGAYGCFCSHKSVLQVCLAMGLESVLIFEDDAVFVPDFTRKAKEFLDATPDDWQMLYLGGQLLGSPAGNAVRAERLSDMVLRPFNCNRLHAYAVRGAAIPMLCDWLAYPDNWRKRDQVDHHIGRLHTEQRVRVYCPPVWLVGQAAGESDIQRGKTLGERYWLPPREISRRAT